MRRRTFFDLEINRLLEEISSKVPEGYEITISIVRGEASMSLTGPSGNDMEVCTDDLDFEKSLKAHALVAIIDARGGE